MTKTTIVGSPARATRAAAMSGSTEAHMTRPPNADTGSQIFSFPELFFPVLPPSDGNARVSTNRAAASLLPVPQGASQDTRGAGGVCLYNTGSSVWAGLHEAVTRPPARSPWEFLYFVVVFVDHTQVVCIFVRGVILYVRGSEWGSHTPPDPFAMGISITILSYLLTTMHWIVYH